MRFEHTVVTTAPAGVVWDLWTDVANWPRWDPALKSATLDGPFALHRRGRLVSRGSPAAAFEITDLEPGRSYTFSTVLPGGRLHVRRTLAPASDGTRFTHEVWFTGATGAFFGRLLGRRYRAILPEAMRRLKAAAEERERPAGPDT